MFLTRWVKRLKEHSWKLSVECYIRGCLTFSTVTYINHMRITRYLNKKTMLSNKFNMYISSMTKLKNLMILGHLHDVDFEHDCWLCVNWGNSQSMMMEHLDKFYLIFLQTGDFPNMTRMSQIFYILTLHARFVKYSWYISGFWSCLMPSHASVLFDAN